MKLPPTYREQPACANCRHTITRIDHMEAATIYCTREGPPKPEPESGGAPMSREYVGAILDWYEGREIIWHYVCDEHEPRAD